jgi:predicted phosphoadenosine phosphosulfate sulfurtransferase
VEVIHRDEEIMFPGLYEYSARMRERPEVVFHWIYANQPIINAFDRTNPFWWVFDPTLPPDKWVRQPPPYAKRVPNLNIRYMTTPERFPLQPGQKLYSVVGIRAQESRNRYYGVFKAGGHLLKPDKLGVIGVRPIYDWTDDDVWLAIKRHGWDYCRAYDTMFAILGKKRNMRIAPPTMNVLGLDELRMAAAAWPRWFDRVCERLPGMRTAAQFGKRALTPRRNLGETWEAAYQRECIDEAPAWIAERAVELRRKMLSSHAHHATTPFPEVQPCYNCLGAVGSWRKLTLAIYGGDPVCAKVSNRLREVEPSAFRPGAGTWEGGEFGW